MSGIFPDGGVPSGQALGADPNLGNDDVANCQNGALFYPTNRCPPRFDPKAENAQISEIVNLMQCAGEKYDCSKYDNMCRAVESMFTNKLFGCLPRSFPASEHACSIQYLAQVVDSDGCTRISSYSPGSSQLARTTTSSIWGQSYPETMHPISGQETVGTHIYDRNQLSQDVVNNTVNTAVLFGPGNQNLLAEMMLDLPCTSAVDIDYYQVMSFDPGRNNGNGARSYVVIELDGKIAVDGGGSAIGFGIMTNFLGTYTGKATLGMSAGKHKIRFILTSYGGAAAQISVVGQPNPGNASWTARVAVS